MNIKLTEVRILKLHCFSGIYGDAIEGNSFRTAIDGSENIIYLESINDRV